MAFGSVVQQKGGTTNTASPAALAFTSNNTIGNILICAGRLGYTGTFGAVTIGDSQGNTWIKQISDNWSAGNEFFVFYCLNCKGGANTVTVTGNSSITNLISLCIGEYTGNGSSAVFDKSAFADTGAGVWTTADSGAITPTQNGELLIAAQGNGTAPASVTAGATWTNLQSDSARVASIESQVQASAASIHGIFTLSASTGACGILSFASTAPLTPAVSPTFSPGTGIYPLPLTVTITSTTPSSTIYYTTDGSTPTHSSSSIANGGTISLSVGAVVSALAAASGFSDSSVAIAQYGTPCNLWTPQGVVIPNSGSELYAQPNVIYDTSPQILSPNPDGHIFKAWYDSPNAGTLGLYYGESPDGVTWTPYSGNPVSTALGQAYLPKITKQGSTYYGYFGSSGNIQAWTSPDGLAWTVQNATAIVPSQAWESGAVYQLSVIDVISGTWYGYYSGGAPNFYMGLATSTDGIHWTKNVSNPVISVATSNFTFQKINGIYYGWSQARYPNATLVANGFTGIFRFSSPSVTGPWTQLAISGVQINSYYAAVPGDFNTGLLSGGNSLTNQLGDPVILSALGNCYLYFTISVVGVPGGGGISSAIAFNTTFAQLVSGFEGVNGLPISGFPNLNLNALASDPGTGANANPIGGNWTPLGTTGGFVAAQRASNLIEPSTTGSADSWWNALTWNPNQYAIATVATCTSSSVGVSLRQNISGALNAYRFFWTGTLGSGGTCFIQRMLSGTGVNIASWTGVTLNVGDTIMGVVNADNLEFYWNGYLVGCAIDTVIANGAAGFLVSSSVAAADAQLSAWMGGTYQGPPGNGISGNLGQAGASYSYTGPTSGSGTADGSGNYNTGEVLTPTGIYTITPHLSGYTFSPVSKTVTLSGSDVAGVNFTAIASVAGSGSMMLMGCGS